MSLVTPSHLGGNSSFAALELLADPEKLKRKLDQLKEAEESAKEQIALVGPAWEILELRKLAGKAEADAQDALLRAQEDAHECVAKAKVDANEIIQEAKAKAAQTEEAIASKATAAEIDYRDAMTKVAGAKQEVAHLDEREQKLTKYREELEAKEAELEDEHAQLLQEKSRLASVRETIDSLLR